MAIGPVGNMVGAHGVLTMMAIERQLRRVRLLKEMGMQRHCPGLETENADEHERNETAQAMHSEKF